MLQTWEMIAFVSYGFPSVILYAFVLHQLLWNKNFQSSFFRLATVMGFVDLSNHLSIWLFMKLILWPGTAQLYLSLQNEPFIILLLLFCIYYFTKVRELLLLSTTINRTTAICYPYAQQQIWKKYLLPVIASCLLVPLLFSFHIFTGTAEIWPFLENSTASYVLDVQDTILPIRNALLNAVHTSTISLCSLILNIISFTTLYFRTRSTSAIHHHSNNKKIPNKSEIHLFLISFVDFSLDCIAVAQQLYSYSFVIRGIYYDPVFDRLYLIYPWIYDLINLSRPYLLICMCKQMRNVFFGFFEPKIQLPIISISGSGVWSS